MRFVCFVVTSAWLKSPSNISCETQANALFVGKNEVKFLVGLWHTM